MASWSNNQCGTVACLAGHVEARFAPDKWKRFLRTYWGGDEIRSSFFRREEAEDEGVHPRQVAQKILGLDEDTASDLFTSNGPFWDAVNYKYPELSDRDKVVRVLELLLLCDGAEPYEEFAKSLGYKYNRRKGAWVHRNYRDGEFSTAEDVLYHHNMTDIMISKLSTLA
jgi:hypothetical protein